MNLPDTTNEELHQNRYLAQANQGQNHFWRYLVTTISMIWAAIFVQVGLLLLAFLLHRTMDFESLPLMTMLVVAMVPFPFSLAALWAGLRLLHRRPLISLINPSGRIAWKRVIWSAAIWFVLAGLSDLILSWINPQNYVWTFEPANYLPFFILALLLIPIQTTTEEMIFRGYLAQWLSRYNRRIWIPLVIPSLVFMLLHGLNPEVLTYGAWLTLPFYFGIGLLLGWITLRSEGLELAIGLHAANNLYAALVVTFPSSALPSPALFTMQEYDPVLGLAVFAIMALLYLVILYGLQRRRILRTVSAAAVSVLLAASLITPAQARSYDAERFDVRIEIQADGSLLVTETVVFRFDGGPYTYAFRQIRLNELDRIEILSASLDGRRLPPGDQAGQVEIKPESNPVEVTWHFEPTSDASRTTELTYRVMGNIRQSENGDGFSWQAIPQEHEYDIRFGSVTILYPAGIDPLEPPSLIGQSAAFEFLPGGIIFHLAEIGRDQAITVNGVFPPGSLIDQPPAWQARILARGQQVRAALPYAGLIFAAVLLSAFLLVERLRRARAIQYPQAIPLGSVSNPPDDLPPGLAGYLVSSLRPDALQFFAAVLDLAERGYIQLQQREKAGLFKAKDYQIIRVRNESGLRAHERFIYSFLFETRKGPREEVSMSLIGQRLASKLTEFSNRAREELETAGVLMPEQFRLRQRLSLAGLLAFIAASVLAVLGGVLIGMVGDNLAFSGMLLAGAAAGLLGAGILCWIYSTRWRVLTVHGHQRRERWLAFRAYIRELIKSSASLQAEWLSEFLPFAVAFSLGDRWVKAFKDRGLSTQLQWARAVDGGYADSSILAAVIITSSASGSSGGGGAGGGGGASGAG